MLSETMLGAVADAVFGYLLGQTGIAEKIRSQLGRDPARLAFREALKYAYRSFYLQYPDLADSLFDEYFLQHSAAPILARCLLTTNLPDPSELVQVWAEQLGQPLREANVNSLTHAAADFLRFMEKELHNREEFYALFDTRNLEAIRKATMHSDQTLNAIDEKLTKMLADPIKVYETTVSRPLGPPFDEVLLPPPEHFVGRDEDQKWLLSRLRTRTPGVTAIAALRGFIGIGKTALAAKVVHQLRGEGHFSDGIAVVFCQGLTDPVDLVRRILTRFDPQRRPPEATELVTIPEIAHQLLNGKETLVVLDNIEPELPVEKAVTPLKMAGATVLVTARHILPHSTVPVEAQRTLVPLSPKEALQVFTISMGRGREEDFALAEWQAIERIIAALNCHTLAVKLAGAYAADLHRDLETLANELEDPKRAIDLPDGETPDAVRLVFAQSVQALSPDVQKLFAALAAFSTVDVSRNAAVALAKALGVPHPEMSVDLLVRRAFVDAFTSEQIPKECDCERLRLHLLLRAFAQEELNSWIEQKRDAAFQALAQYYTIYVTEAKDGALSIDEHNIAGALEWAHDHEQGNLLVVLLYGMRYYWRDRWNTDAYLRYFPWGSGMALAIAQATHDRKDCLYAAHLALTFGQVLQDHGRINEATVQFQVSSTLFTEGEDRRGQAAILFQLGQSARTIGHMEEAKQYLLESLGIFREIGDRSSEGSVLSVLGQLALLCGRIDEGEDYCKQALPILREVQNPGNEGTVLMMFGQIAALRGNMDETNHFLQEAMPLLQGVYGDGGVVTTLAWLGQMALASGRPHEAEKYLQESLALARRIQDRRGEAASLVALGLVALLDERLDDAELLVRAGVAIYHEIQDRGQEGASSVYLAHIAEKRGQFDEAEKQYRQCLDILRETQIASCAHVAGALGMFLLEQPGKTEEGCALLMEAEQRYVAMGLHDEAKQMHEVARQAGCLE